MKINASQFTVPFILLLTLISSPAVYADSSTSANTEQPDKAITYQHKMPEPGNKNHVVSIELNKNSKKILIEESREMSPFFKLGIAINIIMILVFAWWFRKEWRSKK